MKSEGGGGKNADGDVSVPRKGQERRTSNAQGEKIRSQDEDEGRAIPGVPLVPSVLWSHPHLRHAAPGTVPPTLEFQ